ncbi:sodium:solute symporter family transporter [Arenimonas fontis]|uniref:Sodium/solute symporter n=1 Tax=Arenimonas fontis TaxID=2608255 RepID=A0A5B2Z847_9GAMM|nr:sodium/solute symporter [Arenimonas fontis]KAA2284908.1 sodium/solute symporter [Arenimonas fontis]
MLHPLDYAVLAAYLLAVLAICARTARRSPGSDELFLAGRSLGVGVVGLSLFASNISSTTLIGLPGAAWQSGISVANYEWMAALVLVFTAVFVAPVLLGNRLTTIPELLEKRFDARMRKYLSAVTVFLALVLDTAGSLYAGAVVLMLFVPGLPLGLTCALIAVFAGLYTAAGGLRAVAYSDVLQSLVLLVGSLVLCLLVFGEFDFRWSQVVAAVEPDKLSLIRPLDDPALPWLGTLIGLPVLGFYYWTMNQYVSQRLLGARDVGTAGRGAVLAALLKLLPLFLMVIPGVMAIALFTDLERPDAVFPRLVAEYAPAGLAGLILAGLLAAIMSSVDSALNSSSTLITLDFVKPRRPDMDTRAMARLGRIITLVLVALAALWAPAIDRFPGLFAYLQQTFAYVTPPLVAVFLLGLFGRRVGARAAFRGTLSGHALSAAWFAASQLGWLDLHFTIVAGLLFGLSLLAILAWQALDGETPRPDQLAAVARSRAPAVPVDVRWGAGLVVALTAALVLAFR